LNSYMNATHDLKITPETDIKSETISVSLKVSEEFLEYRDKEKEGVYHTQFVAKLTDKSFFTARKNFLRFDENSDFWDEDVVVILEYGGKKETIKLDRQVRKK
jgi:hypothetical protein